MKKRFTYILIITITITVMMPQQGYAMRPTAAGADVVNVRSGVASQLISEEISVEYDPDTKSAFLTIGSFTCKVHNIVEGDIEKIGEDFFRAVADSALKTCIAWRDKLHSHMCGMYSNFLAMKIADKFNGDADCNTILCKNIFQTAEALAYPEGWSRVSLQHNCDDHTLTYIKLNNGVLHIAVDATADDYSKHQSKHVNAEIFIANSFEDLKKQLCLHYGGALWQDTPLSLMQEMLINAAVGIKDCHRNSLREIMETIFGEAVSTFVFFIPTDIPHVTLEEMLAQAPTLAGNDKQKWYRFARQVRVPDDGTETEMGFDILHDAQSAIYYFCPLGSADLGAIRHNFPIEADKRFEEYDSAQWPEMYYLFNLLQEILHPEKTETLPPCRDLKHIQELTIEASA